MCAKYDQFSFLFKSPGASLESQFITRDGSIDDSFIGISLNDISQKYFTKINKDFKHKTSHSGFDKADRRFTTTYIKEFADRILLESSLSRIFEHVEDYDIAIISGCRKNNLNCLDISPQSYNPKVPE